MKKTKHCLQASEEEIEKDASCQAWTPKSDTQNSGDQRQINCWLLQVTHWLLHICYCIHIHGYMPTHTYIQTQREIKFLKLKGKKLNWITTKILQFSRNIQDFLWYFLPLFPSLFNNLFLFDIAFYFNPQYIKLQISLPQTPQLLES